MVIQSFAYRGKAARHGNVPRTPSRGTLQVRQALGPVPPQGHTARARRDRQSAGPVDVQMSRCPDVQHRCECSRVVKHWRPSTLKLERAGMVLGIPICDAVYRSDFRRDTPAPSVRGAPDARDQDGCGQGGHSPEPVRAHAALQLQRTCCRPARTSAPSKSYSVTATWTKIYTYVLKLAAGRTISPLDALEI